MSQWEARRKPVADRSLRSASSQTAAHRFALPGRARRGAGGKTDFGHASATTGRVASGRIDVSAITQRQRQIPVTSSAPLFALGGCRGLLETAPGSLTPPLMPPPGPSAPRWGAAGVGDLVLQVWRNASFSSSKALTRLLSFLTQISGSFCYRNSPRTRSF